MGEMIKFGIKLAMTIATAVALTASIVILFTYVSQLIGDIPTTSTFNDIFKIVQIYLPLNLYVIMASLSTLGAFKVAYWAADKMIQFIEASS